MSQEDYKAAADRQGITAIINALASVGISAKAEQTGGFTMVATFEFHVGESGRPTMTFVAHEDGAAVYATSAWLNGGFSEFVIEADSLHGIVIAAKLLAAAS